MTGKKSQAKPRGSPSLFSSPACGKHAQSPFHLMYQASLSSIKISIGDANTTVLT